MPSVASAVQEHLDPQERGLDLTEYNPEKFQTKVDLAPLAKEYSHGVVTFRVETRKQLFHLMNVVAPSLEVRGVQVRVRTDNEELKQELRQHGKHQVVGSRSNFLVEGDPTSRIHSNQRETQLHVSPSAHGIKEHFEEFPQKRLAEDEVMQVRDIPVSRLDVRSLERWLSEGRRASILIDDIEAVSEQTWMALRTLKHTYKDLLVLNAKQRKGQDVKEIWKRVGAKLHAQGNGHAVHLNENRRPSSWIQRAGRRIGSIFRSAWEALAA